MKSGSRPKETGKDVTLEFFSRLEANRSNLFGGRGQPRGNELEAYLVSMLLFTHFLRETYHDGAFNEALVAESGMASASFSPGALPLFVEGAISDFNWSLRRSSAGDTASNPRHVDPWILGYIYERWTNNRQSGSFFTPDGLADSIVLLALYEWLEVQADVEFGGHDQVRRAFVLWRKNDQAGARKHTHTYAWLLAKLCAIRIVDLSVGGGAFLVAATRVLYHLMTFCMAATDRLGPAETGAVIREIFCKNIFGFDIDKIAIEIAKMRLWLVTAELDPNALLDRDKWPALNNLFVANSLSLRVASPQSSQLPFVSCDSLDIGPVPRVDVPADLTFDVCVGNPPFIALSQKNGVQGKSEFVKNWNERHPNTQLRTTSDLSNFFILQGVELLRGNGVLTYITSRNFFDTQYGDAVRKFLARQVELRRVFTLHEHPFVQKGLKAKANTVILSLVRKQPVAPVRFYHLMDWNRPLVTVIGRRITRADLLASQNWTQTLFRNQLRDDLQARCAESISSYARVRMGVKTGANAFFLLKEGSSSLQRLEESLSPAQVPSIVKNSRDVTGYVLPSRTAFRLLNLCEVQEDLRAGYDGSLVSPAAEYIFEFGIKYPCQNCQAMARRQHHDHPERFPHAGICVACDRCRSTGTSCDRPVDRLSVRGHAPQWYTLCLTQKPIISVQCVVDTQIGVFWNSSGVYVTDQFQVIDSVDERELAPILFMYLISRIPHLFLEGRGMHRARYDGSFMLKIQVNHLSELPCPALDRMGQGARKRVMELFDSLVLLEDSRTSAATALRDEVDSVFLHSLGYPESEIPAIQTRLRLSLEEAIRFRWEKTTHRAASKQIPGRNSGTAT